VFVIDKLFARSGQRVVEKAMDDRWNQP